MHKHKKNIFENVNDYGLGKDDAWKGYAENSPYWEKFNFIDPGDDGLFQTEDDIDSYAYVELADAPDTHYFLTNVEGSYRKYMALQLIFNKRMSDRWQLLASLVWSKTWGNIGGNYFSITAHGSGEWFDGPLCAANSGTGFGGHVFFPDCSFRFCPLVCNAGSAKA